MTIIPSFLFSIVSSSIVIESGIVSVGCSVSIVGGSGGDGEGGEGEVMNGDNSGKTRDNLSLSIVE
jgi:hypothetical protein